MTNIFVLFNIIMISRFLLADNKPMTWPRYLLISVIQMFGFFVCSYNSYIIHALVAIMVVNLLYKYGGLVFKILLSNLIALFSSFLISYLYIIYSCQGEYNKYVIYACNYILQISQVRFSQEMFVWINIFIFGLLLVSNESNYFIRFILDLFSIKPSNGDNEVESIEEYKTGRLIGCLERLLIYIFILVGEYNGIGFVLVAKGFVRFSELGEGKERYAEYVLAGTLLSITCVVIVSIIIKYLFGMYI